jgi:glycine/D-amino acid oxidase-like deaminating enzyme
MIDVVVIGAGVSGASAAHHLLKTTPSLNIVILDCGRAGEGVKGNTKLPDHAQIRSGDLDSPNSLNLAFARTSGSAVLPSPASTVKMMINVFNCTTTQFIANNGEECAKHYLDLSTIGIEVQKSLAISLGANKVHLSCLGSYYLCYEPDAEAFEQEFNYLLQLGANVEYITDPIKVKEIAGSNFHRAIYFPDDAIIDSAAYSKSLVLSLSTERVKMIENCSPVCKIENKSTGNGVYTYLEDGTLISSKYVVVATGGLFPDPVLSGILNPIWSYLVKMKPVIGIQSNLPSMLNMVNSPNFFTFPSNQDWAMVNGFLRISGEDGFSALKPPRMHERTTNLANWAVSNFKSLDPVNWNAKYGVYSQTPDFAPIVGRPNPESNICYLLGCNASGQAVLSYGATLIPALLGYREMSDIETKLFSVMNIRRFCLLKEVMNPKSKQDFCNGKDDDIIKHAEKTGSFVRNLYNGIKRLLSFQFWVNRIEDKNFDKEIDWKKYD